MSALSASVTLSRLLTKLHEHALSVPSELALRITDAPLVDRRWLERRYRHARCLHAPALPPLADADRAIVQALEREGAYATSLQALALPGSDGLLEAADGLSASLAERSRKAGFDGRHTVTATAAELLARPEILLWGLSSRLLDIVENYLGLPVACDGLSYYYSRADGRQAGPRLWHRDREDRRMVKIAVYVSDVDEDGGPFELLRPGANAALTTGRAAGYQVLDDGALRSRLGSEAATDAVQTITGARGTVIFTDTARFYHRGRPPSRHDRSAIFYGYFARVPQHPFFGARSPLSRAQLARLAESLPPRQRAAMLWRDALPPLARWIPPNRVRV